jgi:hypothetical protein
MRQTFTGESVADRRIPEAVYECIKYSQLVLPVDRFGSYEGYFNVTVTFTPSKDALDEYHEKLNNPRNTSVYKEDS